MFVHPTFGLYIYIFYLFFFALHSRATQSIFSGFSQRIHIPECLSSSFAHILVFSGLRMHYIDMHHAYTDDNDSGDVGGNSTFSASIHIACRQCFCLFFFLLSNILDSPIVVSVTLQGCRCYSFSLAHTTQFFSFFCITYIFWSNLRKTNLPICRVTAQKYATNQPNQLTTK